MPRQSNSRIADLLLRKGDVQANAVVGSSRAWEQGVGELGQIGANTLKGVLIDAPAYERQAEAEKKHQEMADIALRRQRHEEEGTKLTNVLQSRLTNPETGVFDHDKAASELTAAGYSDFGDALKAKVEDQRARTIQTLNANLSGHKTAFAKAQALVEEAKLDPKKWGVIQPYLTGIAAEASPELAGSIKKEYDPAHVDQITAFIGATLADTDMRERSQKKLAEARAMSKDDVASFEAYSHALGGWLSTTNGPETWDQMMASAKQMGVPDKVIERFPKTWSDDAPFRALQVITPGGLTSGDQIKGNQSDMYNLYVANKGAAMAAKRAAGEPGPLSAGEVSEVMKATIKEFREKQGTGGDGNYNLQDRLTAREKEKGGPLTTEEIDAERASFEGRPAPDPLYKEHRDQYEDMLKLYTSVAGEAPRRTGEPPDWKTWRWQEFGIGVPSRNSQVVRDLAWKILQSNEAKQGIQIPTDGKGTIDEAAKQRLIDTFLANNWDRMKAAGFKVGAK